MSRRIFQGFRVLELSQHISGAYCGKLFAMFGADVVRVDDLSQQSNHVDARYLYLNTGKQSVDLAITSAEGRSELLRLATSADVFIEDPGPAAIERLGIGYELLAAGNPALVYVSASPFGSSGPYAKWQAEPITVYALGGYTCLTGDPDREPLQGPGPQPEYLAGINAFTGACLALLERQRGGRGQRVEVSEMEAVASAHQWTVARYSYAGRIQRRIGNRYDSGHPITVYPCKDGYVSPGVSNDEQGERFAQLTGIPELLTDERFATSISRLVNADAYDQLVLPWLAERGKHEIADLCQEWRIPCAAVSTPADVLQHPQLASRQFWHELEHPLAGNLRYAGPPIGFSRTPGEIKRAPLPGEHQHAVGARWSVASQAVAPLSHIPDDANRSAVLSGVRVVDLTRVWAGPLATRILADFGAEVIRIQRPITPGAARISRADAERSGFYPGGEPGEHPWNRNAFLNEFARNKRSVAVDLSHEEGRDFVRRLVAASDVVVENFSPRVMPNLGLDYASLCAIRPDLIMASMPGYGANGPYRDRVAYGTTLEPEAGFSALMGYPGRGPQRLGVAYPDPVAGVHTAAAIIAALLHRQATGEGQHIEVAQLESACAFIGDALIEYQLTGKLPAPQGNRHPRFAPQGCYACAGDDRWLTISVRTDDEWAALCGLIGKPALAAEPRFATAEGRRAHHDEIDAVIGDWTAQQEMHDAMAILQRAGIPAGAVLDARDMANDPHLEARGFFVDLSHPEAGRHRYPGQPIRLSHTPAVMQSDAPLLGADTRAIATELLGLAPDEYARLVQRGTLAGIDEAAVQRSTR